MGGCRISEPETEPYASPVPSAFRSHGVAKEGVPRGVSSIASAKAEAAEEDVYGQKAPQSRVFECRAGPPYPARCIENPGSETAIYTMREAPEDILRGFLRSSHCRCHRGGRAGWTDWLPTTALPLPQSEIPNPQFPRVCWTSTSTGRRTSCRSTARR